MVPLVLTYSQMSFANKCPPIPSRMPHVSSFTDRGGGTCRGCAGGPRCLPCWSPESGAWGVKTRALLVRMAFIGNPRPRVLTPSLENSTQPRNMPFCRNKLLPAASSDPPPKPSSRKKHRILGSKTESAAQSMIQGSAPI